MSTPPEIPPVNFERHRPDSRCAEHLGNLARDLIEFGVPHGMHRVGRYTNLGDVEPPAILPGLGEGHTQLPTNENTDLEIARTLVMQMLQSRQAGAAHVTVLDGAMSGAFADFSNLGSDLFTQLQSNALSKHLQEIAEDVIKRRNAGIEAGTLVNPHEILVITGADKLKPAHLEELKELIDTGPNGAVWCA